MPGLILIGLPAAGVPFENSDLKIIKEHTPFDTGYLESRWVIGDDGYSIVNDADYAAYVEFGHHTRSGSEVAGQLFLHDVLPELLQRMYERAPELLEDYELLPGEFEVFVGY